MYLPEGSKFTPVIVDTSLGTILSNGMPNASVLYATYGNFSPTCTFGGNSNSMFVATSRGTIEIAEDGIP